MSVISSPLPEIADRIARLPDTATLAVVKDVKKAADQVAARVAGPDRRLSNAGRNGARLRTRDTWQRGAKTATIWATPPGPWRWVTDGTGPHVIGAGRANRRTGNYAAARFKAGRRRRLVVDGSVVTGPIFHPGSSGKGAWDDVGRRARQIVPKVYARELRKAVNG